MQRASRPPTRGEAARKQVSSKFSAPCAVALAASLRQHGRARWPRVIPATLLIGALVARNVTRIRSHEADGLHNPMTVHGTYPIVGGVATAFNARHQVAVNALAVPLVAALLLNRAGNPTVGGLEASRRVLKALAGVAAGGDGAVGK